MNVSTTLATLLLIGWSFACYSQSIEWQKVYGGTDNDRAEAIIQAEDGGYVIAGETQSSDGDVTGSKTNGCNSPTCYDYWIVKINSSGHIEWQKVYGGSHNDEAHSVVQTHDGGYIVAGQTSSSDGDVPTTNPDNCDLPPCDDYWVIKLDASGNKQWSQIYGGGDIDRLFCIKQTTDHGFLLAGYSETYNGGHSDTWNVYAIKIDSLGNVQWDQNYGGSKDDHPSALIQTSDGGYAMAGQTWSSDGDLSSNNGLNDCLVMKISSSGTLDWAKNYGGSNIDIANTIQQTPDGGYIVAGRSESSDGDVAGNYGDGDYWVFKLDAAGNMEWEKNYGGSGLEGAMNIRINNAGNYVIAGYSESSSNDVSNNAGNSDFWFLELDTTGTIQREQSYGGSRKDHGYHIQQTSDLGYVAAGITKSSDGDVTDGYADSCYIAPCSDFWVVKLKGQGVGMNSKTSSTSYSIYPNPTQNQLHIELQTSSTAWEYHIHTITGRQAKSGQLNGRSTHTLDVSELAPGMYLLEMRTEDEVQTKKVVIEQ